VTARATAAAPDLGALKKVLDLASKLDRADKAYLLRFLRDDLGWNKRGRKSETQKGD
jgi:hypothetical protein